MDTKRFGVELEDHVYYDGYAEVWDEAYYEVEAATKEEAIETALEWWDERIPNYELDCNVPDEALDEVFEWWAERKPRINVSLVETRRF